MHASDVADTPGHFSLFSPIGRDGCSEDDQSTAYPD